MLLVIHNRTEALNLDNVCSSKLSERGIMFSFRNIVDDYTIKYKNPEQAKMVYDHMLKRIAKGDTVMFDYEAERFEDFL